MAKEKIDEVINSPVSYIYYDINKFMNLTFSSDWFHTVPSLVFLVSVAIAIRNKNFLFLLRPLNKFKNFYGYLWITNILQVIFILFFIIFVLY